MLGIQLRLFGSGAKRLAAIGILSAGIGGYSWLSADPTCSGDQVAQCMADCSASGSTYAGCDINYPYLICGCVTYQSQ
jgi:hypothetical protein